MKRRADAFVEVDGAARADMVDATTDIENETRSASKGRMPQLCNDTGRGFTVVGGTQTSGCSQLRFRPFTGWLRGVGSADSGRA